MDKKIMQTLILDGGKDARLGDAANKHGGCLCRGEQDALGFILQNQKLLVLFC